MIVLYILLGIVTAIAGTWVLMPIIYGVPWRPTHRDRIRKALQLAALKPNETLYDLGAGDGRVLILAAREFGAKATGIEAGILQIALAKWMAQLSGVGSQVRLMRGDFYRADLHDADVIFAYLTSAQAVRLKMTVEAQLKRGARVVTVAFEFPGWQPDAFDRDNLIFLYVMPPTQGSLSSFLELRP